MVEGEAADKLGVGGGAVLHLHDFHHVQVGFLGGLVDGQDGIDDVGRELLGQGGVQLGRERCSGDGEEELPVDFFRQLEIIKKLGGGKESVFFFFYFLLGSSFSLP